MNKLILAAAIVLSASVSAHAADFKSKACSKVDTSTVRPSVVDVEQVCLGSVNSKPTLFIKANDGSAARLYTLEVKLYAPKMGPNPYPFTGTEIGGTTTVEGVYVYTTGVTVSRQIKLKTSGNLTFEGNLYDDVKPKQ
jgi:hypothetical protein